jgi:hypothetical protein
MSSASKLYDVTDAIEALEWGSCDGCGQHYTCPVCGATKTTWDESGMNELPGKHKEDCPIPALIAKLRAAP